MARLVPVTATGVFEAADLGTKVLGAVFTAAAAAGIFVFRDKDGSGAIRLTVHVPANTTTSVSFGETGGAEFPTGLHITITGAAALAYILREGR